MEIGAIRHLQVIAGLIFVLALESMAGCEREKSAQHYQVRTGPMPDQVLADFEITETSTGQKEWKMKADTAYFFESTKIIETRHMVITFFDEKGEVKSVLHAKRGRINRSNDDMEAMGDVVMTSRDGTRLETQSLLWSSSMRQIMTEDSVKIVRQGDELSGWGFSGDPDLGTFTIKSRMKAKIRQSGSQ